jgi:D-lactate dehydrogenase (cytochrome)
MLDPAQPAEVDRAHAFADRLARRAIRMDGTSTGEHGVGLGKREYLRDEHGEVAIDTMRAIKRALDPREILNPGKILPPL